MKLSIVSATFNRAELLDRALYTYSKQTMPFEDWEYIIADDGSQDNTKEVVQAWIDAGLPLRYFDVGTELGLPKVPGTWRDGCKVRNAASTHAFGEVLIMTHPEIMIPPTALEAMYDAISENPGAWATAIPYWLPEGKLPPWKRSLDKLRSMDGFYKEDWVQGDAGKIDYANNNQERRQTWESEVFWAMKMSLWRWLGGFREFEVWGSVDMDFLGRRRKASIPTVIVQDIASNAPSGNLMVYHQWHGESPRDMEKAMKALAGADYSTVDSMRREGGLYAVYNHGHRERDTEGGLAQILGDHKERYQWSTHFTEGKVVLDIPCGTGYGAAIIDNASWYYGIDIDAESIEWAKKHYVRDKAEFYVGDLCNIPLPDNHVDQILCFEGLEHIEDKQGALAEFHRVLRPGGTFIVSTPNPKATSGTPWDRWIIPYEDLMLLFSDGNWTKLDSFFQRSYGYSPVEAGVPPDNAQITIVGGTVVK